MEFIQSTLEYGEIALTAGDVHTYDLPVNPLSFALITLKLTAEAPSATDIPNLLKVAEMLDKIEVLYKGSAVYSLSGIDCLASGLLVNNFESWGCNLDMQIETVELPDASPTQFIKQTTKVATPGATGQYDIELPIGNDIDSLVINGETIPAGATNTMTIARLEILVDNINHFYPESQFSTLNAMAGRLRAAPGYWGFHAHETPVTPVVAGDPTSAPVVGDHLIPNHLV